VQRAGNHVRCDFMRRISEGNNDRYERRYDPPSTSRTRG
jgi:hypothetical protein